MTTWTAAAKAELEQYFHRIRPGLRAGGADADEVIEDLRRHLDAEIAASGLAVVTEADVRRLLSRIGTPTGETPPVEAAPSSPAPAAAANPARMSLLLSGWLLFAGTLLPLAALLIEAVTGMCGGAFFDPVPTWAHLALVALVPLANGWAWHAIRRGDARHRVWLGWANGATVAIAAVYSVIFLPLLLPGLLAVLFFGWGLLPWAPALALMAALWLRRRLRRMDGDGARLPGAIPGFAIGLLAFLLAEAPVTLTRVGAQWAASESPETSLAGVRLLRAVGREEQLLRDCYGYTTGAQNMDLMGRLITGGQRVSPEQARATFYRVIGDPFNARPAPLVRTGRGVFGELNDWTWDADHGADQVGGRIRGLSLAASRLDTVVNAPAAWSYTEWTLEFRNDSAQEREARAQLLLPPGGVVSRLTLWVEGEEREAAFAGRAKVREAYREVAVVQRRDPVLVTTAGPDRVLAQCFPVPANGGRMKLRIGITAPLWLDGAGEAVVALPRLLERNFSIPPGVRHAVWLEGAEFTAAPPELCPGGEAEGRKVLQGDLSNAALAAPDCVARVRRDPEIRHAWTRDPLGLTPRFIRQSLTEKPSDLPTALIVVVDGSRAMGPHLRELADALGAWPPSQPLTVLVAGDEVVTLGQRSARSSDASELEVLAAWRATGGQDNVPALRRAFELAASQGGAVVLWAHAPVPALLSPAEPLVQALERNPSGTRLLSFQIGAGPDRLIEQLDGLAKVVSVPRGGEAGADLRRLIEDWRDRKPRLEFKRAVVADESEARADGAVEGGQHLARLWAVEEVRRLTADRLSAEAAQEAARRQLVTPVSGAVVLETAAQFAAAGLTPVDPQTVPAIPEPSVAALLLLGGGLLLLARRRKSEKLCDPRGRQTNSRRLFDSRP